MLRLILTRIILMLLAMFVVVTGMFFGIRLSTGDPTLAIQGSYATASSIARIRAELGLDLPLWQQYLIYIGGVLRGDLGVSLQNNRPVLGQIISVLPYTFDLTFWGMVVGMVLGVPMGFVSAVKRNGWWDQAIRFVTLGGVSLPPFIMAYLLIIVFVVWLGLFPVAGAGNLSDPVSRAQYLVLPALSLGLVIASYVARMTRTSVIEIMGRDFIRTGRAKGLSERAIMVRYVLRLSWVSIITLIGIYSAVSIGGSVVVELVFSRPGVGRLVVGAISQSDYTVVQGAIIFYAAFVSIINLAVDLTYALVDPRIRYE